MFLEGRQRLFWESYARHYDRKPPSARQVVRVRFLARITSLSGAYCDYIPIAKQTSAARYPFAGCMQPKEGGPIPKSLLYQ